MDNNIQQKNIIENFCCCCCYLWLINVKPKQKNILWIIIASRDISITIFSSYSKQESISHIFFIIFQIKNEKWQTKKQNNKKKLWRWKLIVTSSPSIQFNSFVHLLFVIFSIQAHNHFIIMKKKIYNSTND